MARKTTRTAVDEISKSSELVDVLAFTLFALVGESSKSTTDWLDATTATRNEYRKKALAQMHSLGDMGLVGLEIRDDVVKTAAENLRTRPASLAYHANEFTL